MADYTNPRYATTTGVNIGLANARTDINDYLKNAYSNSTLKDQNLRFGFDHNIDSWALHDAAMNRHRELVEAAGRSEEEEEELRQLETSINGIQTIIDDPQVPRNILSSFSEDRPLSQTPRTNTGPAGPSEEAKENAKHNAKRNRKIADDSANALNQQSLDEVEARGGETETSEARHIRTTQQCYLLYNMESYSKLHRDFLKSKVPGSSYNGIKDKELQSPGYWSEIFKYQRILLMEGEGSTSEAVNRLYVCSGSEAFSNITTSEYARLQPLLKIYKVDAFNTNLIEMKFGTSTSTDGIASQLMVSGAIGTDRAMFTRGTASGIKSFDWKYLGTDPFTATKDIEATLKIRLQHFSELTKTRTSKLYGQGSQGQTAKYKYLDLILQPDCRDSRNDKDDSTERKVFQGPGGVHAPECYEIRVDVGYQPQSMPDLSPSVRDGLGCQRQSLYLTLVDHKFDFKNDGTLDLVVNYRGRLNTVMRDKKFNVLMPGGGFSEVQFRNPDTPSGGPKPGILDIEAKLGKERSKSSSDQNAATIKKYERWRRIFFAEMKQYMYNGIISKMEDYRWIHTDSVKADAWTNFAAWQDIDSTEDLPPPRTTVSTRRASGEEIDNLQLSDTVLAKDDAEGTAVADQAGITKQAESDNTHLATHFESGDQLIHFCYLGDLIAAVLGNVMGDNVTLAANVMGRGLFSIEVPWRSKSKASTGQRKPSEGLEDIVKNFHLMLGNIDMSLIRPSGAVQNFTTNIAHIAVSMESFRNFWTEKVLTKDTLFYSLFDFLDDLIQDLVTDSVSVECFGGLLSHSVRAQAALISTPTKMSDDILTVGKDGYLTVHVANSTPETPAFSSQTIDPSAQTTSKNTVKQYLILQASDTTPRDLHGVYDKNNAPGRNVSGVAIDDKTRGIYHLSYGRDRGLLKTVQFNKTDQEFLPEARYASEGGMVLNQLANVYDATFELIGNSMFRPGVYIYFSPYGLGTGEPWERREENGETTLQSYSNIMGIGGYHLVTEIANSISDKGFNTTLKARWVTGGTIPS